MKTFLRGFSSWGAGLDLEDLILRECSWGDGSVWVLAASVLVDLIPTLAGLVLVDFVSVNLVSADLASADLASADLAEIFVMLLLVVFGLFDMKLLSRTKQALMVVTKIVCYQTVNISVAWKVRKVKIL